MKLATPGGPQPSMGSPTTRNPADFHFSIFYPVYGTSMVTKSNKAQRAAYYYAHINYLNTKI